MFLSDIKDEDIRVDWLLQHIKRTRVTLSQDDTNALFWQGYNKALTDLEESVERTARNQIRERKLARSAGAQPPVQA